MAGSAHVQSSEAIEAVKAALTFFKDQVDQALSTNDLEMRRVLDWLEHDRPRYWKTRVRVAHDEVTAAKAALTRCLMYPINDERPSCYEERDVVKKAEAQRDYCMEKSERLRHWIREVRHELFEYEGRISQLVELIESDVPAAIGILNQLLTRLEEYQAIRPRQGSGPPTMAGASLAAELWPLAADQNPESSKAAEPSGADAPATEPPDQKPEGEAP